MTTSFADNPKYNSEMSSLATRTIRLHAPVSVIHHLGDSRRTSLLSSMSHHHSHCTFGVYLLLKYKKLIYQFNVLYPILDPTRTQLKMSRPSYLSAAQRVREYAAQILQQIAQQIVDAPSQTCLLVSSLRLPIVSQSSSPGEGYATTSEQKIMIEKAIEKLAWGNRIRSLEVDVVGRINCFLLLEDKSHTMCVMIRLSLRGRQSALYNYIHRTVAWFLSASPVYLSVPGIKEVPIRK